jgi:uncharacterized membrane protein (DUF485 family)
LACAIACETLIYQKQTLLHQRNTNQIKEKFKFNKHVILVKLSLYIILPTLSPFSKRFLNQTLTTICTSSKTSSRWATLMLTTLTRSLTIAQNSQAKMLCWNKF